jgi:TIR domain
MKLFLSHSPKDADLARQLAARLSRAGFVVWTPEAEVSPGDNWAKKIGKALDESDLMVFLVSPGALESDTLRQDMQFALGTKRYAGRVYSVFVGSASAAAKGMPWILRALPHRQVASAKGLGAAVKDIQQMSAGADLSHSHA